MWRGHLNSNLPRSQLKMLPHTPSKQTGMIGALMPSAICSKPGRKRNRLPVRVIAPSAKMHTTCPRLISSRAIDNDSSFFCSGSPRAMGITRIRLNNQCSGAAS